MEQLTQQRWDLTGWFSVAAVGRARTLATTLQKHVKEANDT